MSHMGASTDLFAATGLASGPPRRIKGHPVSNREGLSSCAGARRNPVSLINFNKMSASTTEVQKIAEGRVVEIISKATSGGK